VLKLNAAVEKIGEQTGIEKFVADPLFAEHEQAARAQLLPAALQPPQHEQADRYDHQ
jgi:hypothetical protein